jgi:hypothetical protein
MEGVGAGALRRAGLMVFVTLSHNIVALAVFARGGHRLDWSDDILRSPVNAQAAFYLLPQTCQGIRRMTFPSSATRTERLTALAIFAAVVVLFAFYGMYFARSLVPLSTEMVALELSQRGWLQTTSAYALLLKAWSVVAGPTLSAARGLSLLAAVASIVMVFHIGRRLSRDPLVAACLTISFVLYPPLVGTLVCATPHALVMLLSLLVMEIMLNGSQRSGADGHIYGCLAGVIASLATLMIPLVAIFMPLWLLVCGALTRATAIALIIALATSALMLLLEIHTPDVDVDLSASGHSTFFTALILPYAMGPVFVLLGSLAACSTTVRAEIGVRWLIIVLAAPVVVIGSLWLAVVGGVLTAGQLVTAMGYAVVFAIFAPWPLIVWARRVMPQVKSLLAWIVFPVVMYSCFWVILGPIDPAKFPYSHRQVLQPG